MFGYTVGARSATPHPDQGRDGRRANLAYNAPMAKRANQDIKPKKSRSKKTKKRLEAKKKMLEAKGYKW